VGRGIAHDDILSLRETVVTIDLPLFRALAPILHTLQETRLPYRRPTFEILTPEGADLGATMPRQVGGVRHRWTRSSVAAVWQGSMTRVTWKAAWDLGADLVRGVQDHHVSLQAKQAAYSLLYALPALVIFATSLAVAVDRATGASLSTALQEDIVTRAPEELQPILSELVTHAAEEISGASVTATAVISVLIAFWGAAGGAGALMFACNLSYDVKDDRSYLVRTALRLLLTGGGGALVICWIVLFGFGQRIGEWLERERGHETFFSGILESGRWWGLLFLACAVLFLYAVAPAVPTTVRWLLPGVALAMLCILAVWYGFEFFVKVANPGGAFGAAASVLILLWALYVVSLAVVVGSVVNAVLGRRYDRTLRAALERRAGSAEASGQ
jgi:membrane protein